MANLGGKIKCAAEDLYADQQLADKQYIRQQLDCVFSRGPCDENGNLIRSECARMREGTWVLSLINFSCRNGARYSARPLSAAL